MVFDDDGSYIECETTGESSWLTQSGGMYYLKMWVSRKSSAEACFRGEEEGMHDFPKGRKPYIDALSPIEEKLNEA